MYTLEGVRGYFKGNGATVVKIAPFSALEFFCYELYKNNFYPGKSRNELGVGAKLFCGGLTGMTAQFFTYPVDLVKTYLTINVENESMGMIKCAQEIVAKRGFLGLFQGLGVSLCGIAPFIGIKMASYDFLMTNFAPDKSSKYIVYYILLLGATAGTMAVTATYPFDVTRRLMQLNGSPGHSYKNFPDVIK